MEFRFANSEFETEVWTPGRGRVGSALSFDTETQPIKEGKIPSFVIGQAYAGGRSVYLVHLNHLRDFMEAHKASVFIMHNAPFDVAVVRKEVGFDFFQMIEDQRLFDTLLTYLLWRLATIGDVRCKYSLEAIVLDVLKITISKDEKIRLDFGRFRTGSVINYQGIPDTHLVYAAVDAIATYRLFAWLHEKIQKLSSESFLSHQIQIMGALALDDISRRGIGFDLSGRKELLENLEKKSVTLRGELSAYNYFPGKSGVRKRGEQILQNLEIELPKTQKTNSPSMKSEHLEPFRNAHPFIDFLLAFNENEKLKSFVSKMNKPRIHTRFTSLVSTGRTSSSNPNLQNLPRDPAIRRLFVPSIGHVFVIADYAQIELCALAQVCRDRYGFSKMAELINQGVDLHRWFASILTGKSASEIADGSPERRLAKACDFGFGGGLGANGFLQFAKNTYGLVLTTHQAEQYKKQWISAFPEMELYLADTLSQRHDFSSLGVSDTGIAVALFRRIVSGKTCSTKGVLYDPKTLEWAFNTVMADVAPDYVGVTGGSLELLEEICKETVTTRTGRIRARTPYCAARNTPFQGLAADGAKIALYHLMRRGFATVNFIHDEVIVEVVDMEDKERKRREIERIMIAAMQLVIPDVQIRVKSRIRKCWEP